MAFEEKIVVGGKQEFFVFYIGLLWWAYKNSHRLQILNLTRLRNSIANYYALVVWYMKQTKKKFEFQLQKLF